MTREELAELYRSFRRYAWRLEARDVYGVPAENARLQAFLAGESLPESATKTAWGEQTAAAAAAGRSFARVRMIGHPVTDYTRWEMSVYPENIAAGEDVRILDRAWLNDENPLWQQDVWLFDDETAVIQRYADDGAYLGPELADDPAPYVALRARALELSVPYSEYTLLPDQRSDESVPTREATTIEL
ncbi:DUF6879 family protein [Amycolatopsis minnesotensis]|uniref:DUF6879 domain-containing protein n=1 Tax=Amycolatopsis minnesotensis TaxID=337894 RepID=A0ABN2SAB0_9PSEU